MFQVLSTAVCHGKPIVLLIEETGDSNRKAKLRISGHQAEMEKKMLIIIKIQFNR